MRVSQRREVCVLIRAHDPLVRGKERSKTCNQNGQEALTSVVMSVMAFASRVSSDKDPDHLTGVAGG